MTNSLDPSTPRAYRRRGRPIAAYGLISCIVGIAGLIDRDLLTTSSAVQSLTPTAASVWLASYALGGAMAAYGVLRLNPRVEAYGLWLLIAFCVLNAGAIILNRGPVGGGVTGFSLGLLAYVLHGRIRDLHDAALLNRRRPDRSALTVDGPDRRMPQ